MNALIEAAGELEREFLACPEIPASETPADAVTHRCEWCGAEWEGDERAD